MMQQQTKTDGQTAISLGDAGVHEEREREKRNRRVGIRELL